MLALDHLVRGRRVAVKPNETWASAEDTTGVTQPDTLRGGAARHAAAGPAAVIVGHPAMIATGPLGGHPVETGLVIASTDGLAADVVRAHLGESDLSRIDFPGLSLQQAIEEFTATAYGQRLTFPTPDSCRRSGPTARGA